MRRGFKIYKWAADATSLIRFAPDRNAVMEELLAHMEDSICAKVEAGNDPAAAEEMTLKEMGEPYIVAKEMARIHRPFWGYLWKITNILKIIVLIYIAISPAVLGLKHFNNRYDPNLYYSESPKGYRLLADFTPKEYVKTNGYKVSIARIQIWQTGKNTRFAKYTLKVTNINPWLYGPLFTYYMYTVDNLNNRYNFRYSQYGPLPGKETCGNLAYSGMFKTYFEMWITDIDLNASELKLCFNLYGNDFNITIPVVGGVEYEN